MEIFKWPTVARGSGSSVQTTDSTAMEISRSAPLSGAKPPRLTHRFCLSIFTAVALVALELVGCTVGPNYQPPAEHMPSAWVAPPTTRASIPVQEPLQVERWWRTFNDEELDSLVRRAVHSNLEVQLAAQRIRQARANLGITTAGFFPVINMDGSFS